MIHGIFETEDGYIATGTSDTYLISENSVEAIGILSRVATDDNNGNVWLFGDIGSKTVAIVSGSEISVEKLPSR